MKNKTNFVRRLLLAILSIAVSGTTLAQVCLMGNAAQVGWGTQWTAGPNVYNAYVADAWVGNDILAAQDAWNVTNAGNRLAGWNGLVSASDCPVGQPMQVGALSFSANWASCAAIKGATFDYRGNVAFVDYYWSQCAGCGTNSITVNLDYAWAVGRDPLAGELHLRSVLAHEFGHVLGLGHMIGGTCGDIVAPTCANNPGKETMSMGSYPGPGETCKATVETNDASSAAGLY